MEQVRSSLLGHFVGELGAGDHVVQLQWRRWGSGVRAWSVRPSLLNGQGGGRSVVARARHK